MKLWTVTWRDPHSGTLIEWCGSKREATERKREIDPDIDQQVNGLCEVERVDVPDKKDDLIRWLNDRLGTDNG